MIEPTYEQSENLKVITLERWKGATKFRSRIDLYSSTEVVSRVRPPGPKMEHYIKSS